MEIEELELEVKVYNRLKKAGINTTDELLSEMYKGSSDIKVSAPDAKRCEEALKAVGIIKYVRGDYVTEDDIEPEPLTWDELHNCIGKLVAHDVSIESHRWLKVCWIYDIQDKGEGNLIYNDGGSGYGYSRCSTVNGDLTRDFSPYLKHSGRFFILKKSEVPQVQQQSVIVESADYTKAVTLTRRIKANAQAAQESLWEVCKGLKEMHDGKLYKELGYSSFESYTEEEVGLSRFMAYKYISIGDIKNVESIQQIGVTKLALLAKLDEPQREEVQQNVDVEAVSVRELKKQIAEIQNSNAILQGNITNEQEKSAKLQAQLESKHREWLQACDEKTSYAQQLFHAEENLNEAKDTIQSLEQQLEELEERPIDVAVQTLPDDEEIEKLTAQFKEGLAKHEKDTERRLEELRQHYRKELKEQYDRLTKEAEQANVDVEEEIAEKAELECTIKFATDALRRLARYVMSIDSEDKAYARYAIKKVDEVYDILRKFKEEK